MHRIIASVTPVKTTGTSACYSSISRACEQTGLYRVLKFSTSNAKLSQLTMFG